MRKCVFDCDNRPYCSQHTQHAKERKGKSELKEKAMPLVRRKTATGSTAVPQRSRIIDHLLLLLCSSSDELGVSSFFGGNSVISLAVEVPYYLLIHYSPLASIQQELFPFLLFDSASCGRNILIKHSGLKVINSST